MDPSIPVSVERDQDDVVITPQAELRGIHAGALRGLLLRLLETGAPGCRLDLRHVTELDPLVLAVLISFEQTLHTLAPDAKISIENASADIRALLEATRIIERFPLAS